MKNYKAIIKTEWNKIFEEISSMPGFKRLGESDLTVEHYKSVLRQIYLQTRDNPSLQAAASLKFTGMQRDIMKKYMGHALSEVGHDQLAVSDLKAMGENVEDLPTYRPLAGTSAMISFGYYAAMACPSAVYLGYLYHLESMPVRSGGVYIQRLKSIGVPEDALSFVEEHAKFDVSHMKLNEEYLGVFVRSEEDLENFIYGMRTCGVLYARMLEDAFSAADQMKSHFHINEAERRTENTTVEVAA